MKKLILATLALTVLGTGMVEARPHHRHKVCSWHHHHRVCRWR